MDTLGSSGRRHTLAEYLRLEAESPERWEYRNGEVVSLSERPVRRGLIAANATREIGDRLKGSDAAAYGRSLRVCLAAGWLYSHPDLTIVRGCPELDRTTSGGTYGDTVINPTLVLFVTSPSNERFDRVGRFERLRTRESPREYVLVSQDEPRVETFCRQADSAWRWMAAVGLDQTIRLESLNVDLPLAVVFAGVTFPTLDGDPDD